MATLGSRRYPLTKLPTAKQLEDGVYDDLFRVFNTLRQLIAEIDVELEGYVEEAPENGVPYGREDKEWVAVVKSIVAGTNVTVDDTDPSNPIVNASGGGGGGAIVQVLTAQTSTPQTVSSASVAFNGSALPATSGVAVTGLSVTITPTSATNLLRASVTIPLLESNSSQQYIRLMLTRSDETDVIQAGIARTGTSSEAINSFSNVTVAGSTDPITFTLRAGSNSTGTFYIGRTNSVATPWPGSFNSLLTVEEIAV